MAVGDVQCGIVDANTADIDAVVTALRVSADDKWLMCSIANGLQVCIVHINEA